MEGGSPGRGSEHSFRQRDQQGNIPIEVIRQLKMSFVSIEEIERLKKDSNMYKSTQRNQLGVAKNN